MTLLLLLLLLLSPCLVMQHQPTGGQVLLATLGIDGQRHLTRKPFL